MTHLSTVPFSGNGVLQYLSLTASVKMLPVVRSLKELILVTREMVDDTDFCAKYSSLNFVKRCELTPGTSPFGVHAY